MKMDQIPVNSEKIKAKSSIFKHQEAISRLAMPKTFAENTISNSNNNKRQIRSKTSSLSEKKEQLVKASASTKLNVFSNKVNSKVGAITTRSSTISTPTDIAASTVNNIVTLASPSAATTTTAATVASTTSNEATIVNKKGITSKKKLTENNNYLNNKNDFDENKNAIKKLRKLNTEVNNKVNNSSKKLLNHSNLSTEVVNGDNNEKSITKDTSTVNTVISNKFAKPNSLPPRKIISNQNKTPLTTPIDGRSKLGKMVEVSPAQTPSDYRRPLYSASSSKSSSSSVKNAITRPSMSTPMSVNKVGTASAKAATTLLSMQKELEKYKKQLDHKNKQIQLMVKTAHSTNRLVLGLSCVIRYLNEDLKAFETPNLRKQIKLDELNMKEKLNEIFRLKDESSALKYEANCWQIELKREQNRNSKCKDDMLKMFESERKCIEQNYREKLNEVYEENRLLNEKILSLKQKIEKLDDDYKEEIITKENEISEWKSKFIDCEMKLNGDKDVRIRKINEQCKYLTDEVNSLKAVLELKENDLKSLKKKLNVKIIENDEIPKLNQQINILNQKIEQLEISLKHKIDHNLKLQKENEYLNEKYQTETKHSRRLSMRNEELEFALSESIVDTNFDVTPFKIPKKPFNNGNHLVSTSKLSVVRIDANNDLAGCSSIETSSLNETFVISGNKKSARNLTSKMDILNETGLSDESQTNNTIDDNVDLLDYKSKNEKIFLNNNNDDNEDDKNRDDFKFDVNNDMLKSMSKLPKCVLDSGFGDLN